MPINLLADETEQPVNLLADENAQPEMVNTFLGRLPKHSAEFQSGTPENKALLENMMMTAIGGPGIKNIGSTLKKGAGMLTGAHYLNEVQEAAKKLGSNNFSYTPQTIIEAKKYLPQTEATRQLISKSVGGEYPASFSMRSQLGKHQRDLATSSLASERLLAPKVSELRQNMLGQLDQALRDEGMHVEADMLRKGLKNYSQYMKVKEAAMPILMKLGIPTSIAAAIGFGYKKGKGMV